MDATCNVAERPVPLSWSDQIQQSVVKIILPRSLNTQDAAAQRTSCETTPVVFSTSHPEDWTRCYVNSILQRHHFQHDQTRVNGKTLSSNDSSRSDITFFERDTAACLQTVRQTNSHETDSFICVQRLQCETIDHAAVEQRNDSTLMICPPIAASAVVNQSQDSEIERFRARCHDVVSTNKNWSCRNHNQFTMTCPSTDVTKTTTVVRQNRMWTVGCCPESLSVVGRHTSVPTDKGKMSSGIDATVTNWNDRFSSLSYELRRPAADADSQQRERTSSKCLSVRSNASFSMSSYDVSMTSKPDVGFFILKLPYRTDAKSLSPNDSGCSLSGLLDLQFSTSNCNGNLPLD